MLCQNENEDKGENKDKGEATERGQKPNKQFRLRALRRAAEQNSRKTG